MIFSGLSAAVLLSCALLGFRHGFDYDHIAAISDIAGLEQAEGGRRAIRQTMKLGLAYALGHAATVATLGLLVIALGLSLPAGLDRWAERLVGLTLIVLAGYVLVAILRSGGRVQPASRGAMLVRGFHFLRHRMTGRPPQTHGAPVTASACFGVGVIHGLGAETPSQLALFLLAANLGGPTRGLIGLVCFLAGLLVMNTVMTACAAGVFTTGNTWPWWPATISAITAVYSFTIGTIFLFGWSDHLKVIAG